MDRKCLGRRSEPRVCTRLNLGGGPNDAALHHNKKYPITLHGMARQAAFETSRMNSWISIVSVMLRKACTQSSTNLYTPVPLLV